MAHKTYKVYAVVKIKFITTKIKVTGDQLNREVIIRNSPAKLIEGGRAILKRAIISHHAQPSGKSKIIPRIIIIVREFVRSYAVFARQNSADDESPWAIIMIVAPE